MFVSNCWECCKECKQPVRHPGCHDTCDKYAAAKIAFAKLKEPYEKERSVNVAIEDYIAKRRQTKYRSKMRVI